MLSQDTGFDRDYGANPYAGYDEPGSEPFLLDGTADGRLPPKTRVLAVRRGRDAVVLPLEVARKQRVRTFTAFGRPVVAPYAPGVKSALDAARIGDSGDVGTAALCDPGPGGKGRPVRLRATGDPGRFRGQDGTVCDLTGRAVSGPAKGRRLPPVAGDQQFWFALAAFLTGDVRILR